METPHQLFASAKACFSDVFYKEMVQIDSDRQNSYLFGYDWKWD